MRPRRSAVIVTSLLVAAGAALAGELPQQPTVHASRSVAGPSVRPEVIVLPPLPRSTHRVASAHETPTPRLAPRVEHRVSVNSRTHLPWLRGTQSALAIDGFGVVGASGGNKPRPIASLTKVMTAYVVLRDHPLRSRGTAMIRIGTSDVTRYLLDSRRGGSAVPVALGERLSERQALEALLLPSANNIARLLAVWDAGNIPAFVAKMNGVARELGLKHTHYAEPSGFDARNVSTALDQVRLAEAAMHNPAFRSIVRERHAYIPVAGRIDNVNRALGLDGIVGVKTGSTDAAGACYVFASVVAYGKQHVLLVGAMLGYHPVLLAPEFSAAGRLVHAATRVARPVTVRH